MYFQDIKTKGNTKLPREDRFVLFLAGDDAQAKSIVSKLIEDIGFTAVDSGFRIHGSRKQSPCE